MRGGKRERRRGSEIERDSYKDRDYARAIKKVKKNKMQIVKNKG